MREQPTGMYTIMSSSWRSGYGREGKGTLEKPGRVVEDSTK
jgi:hypothetical protein